MAATCLGTLLDQMLISLQSTLCRISLNELPQPPPPNPCLLEAYFGSLSTSPHPFFLWTRRSVGTTLELSLAGPFYLWEPRLPAHVKLCPCVHARTHTHCWPNYV